MNDIIKNVTGITAATVAMVLLLCVSPFLLIWSVNTLGANIEHTPLNYLAAVVLMALLRGGK